MDELKEDIIDMKIAEKRLKQIEDGEFLKESKEDFLNRLR